jgi:hypothetical protein
MWQPAVRPADVGWLSCPHGGKDMTEDQINQLVREGRVIPAIAAIRSNTGLSLQDAISEYHRRAAQMNGGATSPDDEGAL